MPDMMGEALKYAGLGMAVFPLLPRSKEPATKHGFKDASRDMDQVKTWWSENPEYNIGIATGAVSDGLVVIDIDKHNSDGFLSLSGWEAENSALPATARCITGSGGLHYYYIDRQNQYRNAQDLLPGIDVRGDGGYVVAPPSIHPDGTPYQWDRTGLNKPAMATDTVRQFLKSRKKKEITADYSDVLTALNSQKITEGRRTGTLVSLLGKLVDMGITPDTIKDAVRSENELRCVPPLTEIELEKTIFPALTRGWIPEHPYVEDHTDDFSPLPNPMALGAVLQEPPQLAPVLIEGILRQGHKASLTGPSKAGKSFALMELAIAIAEGRTWFGRQCVQGKVLYINMEIDDASCYNRFLKIYQAHGWTVNGLPTETADNIHVWGLRGKSMPLDKLVPHIIQRAKGQDYKLIIIDPLYKVLDGDENSNSDVSRMVTLFDKITDQTGASIIYAHHFAKGAGGNKDVIDRGSGAGAFARDPDCIITMTQIDQPDEVNQVHTAWRVEFVLREFPNAEPYDVWWDYPLHVFDKDELLLTASVVTSETQKSRAKKRVDTAEKKTRIATIHESVEIVSVNGEFTLNDFMEVFSWKGKTPSRNTIKEYLKEAGYLPKPADKGKAAKWVKAEPVKLSK